jgi:hypothetical protein
MQRKRQQIRNIEIFNGDFKNEILKGMYSLEKLKCRESFSI